VSEIEETELYSPNHKIVFLSLVYFSDTELSFCVLCMPGDVLAEAPADAWLLAVFIHMVCYLEQFVS